MTVGTGIKKTDEEGKIRNGPATRIEITIVRLICITSRVDGKEINLGGGLVSDRERGSRKKKMKKHGKTGARRKTGYHRDVVIYIYIYLYLEARSAYNINHAFISIRAVIHSISAWPPEAF